MIRSLPVVLAGLLVAASGGYWGLRKATSPAPARAPASPTLRVTDELDSEYLLAKSAPDANGGPGFLTFVGGKDECCLGVASATLFPRSQGMDRPELGQWIDAVGIQIGPRLDLRGWLDNGSRKEAHFLNFGVWVERQGERELRTGWARLDPGSLSIQPQQIEVERRESVSIEVRSEDGQPVPGALISLDRGELIPPGVISYLGYTGESGSLCISGLEAGRDWIVRLPDGAGPFGREVKVKVETPRTEPVQITVQGMSGEWRFVKHHLQFRLPGESTRILKVEEPGRELTRVWPVSSWIGPGRGPWTPVYFAYRMTNSDSDPAKPVDVTFKEGKPVHLEDVRVSSKIRLMTPPR